MEKTVIAVIGCGRIALGAHFPAFAQMENVRIKYACDLIIEKAEAMKEKYPEIENEKLLQKVYKKFPNGMTPFGRTVLEKAENKAEIVKQVSIACGKEMHIKYIDAKPQDAAELSEEQELSNFANEFDIPFDVIE